jgi:hypothetical protein
MMNKPHDTEVWMLVLALVVSLFLLFVAGVWQ